MRSRRDVLRRQQSRDLAFSRTADPVVDRVSGSAGVVVEVDLPDAGPELILDRVEVRLFHGKTGLGPNAVRILERYVILGARRAQVWSRVAQPAACACGVIPDTRRTSAI